MINTGVLVLNRSYVPVHITTVRRAFSLMYQGLAKAINEQYEIYNFDDWAELSPESHDDVIGLIDGFIKVPRVIILTAYDRMPKRHVRFSRMNIFLRDKNTCQYCGKPFSRKHLNIDHVVPRSRGGCSVWENVVCSCLQCNHKKGGRTPEEAGMKLIRKPRKPRWTPYMGIKFETRHYKEWLPFLNFVDAAYWNVELVE